MPQLQAITVTQLNSYIKRLLGNDNLLRSVRVQGEISNFKAHSSGHLYFGLKDETGFVRAVMFRGKASRLKFRPENGQRVIVNGSVSVYERDGQYQLYADTMETAGMGDLYLAFEQMKKKLADEGLFADEHKQPLPLLPLRIGVVTSPTGAVWHDIQNVATARFPAITLILYPAAVQGDAATPEIVAGIEYFNRRQDIDVLIVGRGGGSLEDLWAFNTEPVARAIYASRLPVISAVGHETDYTIADLVADRRAATPSQAAEIAVPSLIDLQTRLAVVRGGLSRKLNLKMNDYRSRVKRLRTSNIFRQPDRILQNQRQDADMLHQRLQAVFDERYGAKRHSYELLREKLAVLSPLQTLERGYSITLQNRHVLHDIDAITAGTEIDVLLARGELHCRVEEIKEGWNRHGQK